MDIGRWRFDALRVWRLTSSSLSRTVKMGTEAHRPSPTPLTSDPHNLTVFSTLRRHTAGREVRESYVSPRIRAASERQPVARLRPPEFRPGEQRPDPEASQQPQQSIALLQRSRWCHELPAT